MAFLINDKKEIQKTIIKQRNQLNLLKKELNDKNIEERKKERLKERLNELKSKDKLTKKEKERIKELEELLK